MGIGLERIQQILLIAFILLLPFNLFIGKIFPAVVSLPLYVIDALLVLLGLLFFFNSKKQEIITSLQRNIALFLFSFFLLGVLSIFAHKTAILQFIAENSREIVVHSMFKQIISDDPTQSVNRTLQIALSLFLFLTISVSSLKKEILLKIACIPLALILVTNVYLVLNQQDVALDGGREGVTIYPYGIKEIGRAYFPFVNSLLLSMYLSLSFFAFLYFFFNEKKRKRKIGYFLLLSLLLLVFYFTKGRAALLSTLILYSLLCFTLYRKEAINTFPFLPSLLIGIFLLLATLFSFFSLTITQDFFSLEMTDPSPIPTGNEQSPPSNGVSELQEPIQNELKKQFSAALKLRELDQDTVKASRMTLHWPTALALFTSEPIFGVGTGMFYYSVVDEKRELLCEQKELCADFIQQTDISSTAHSIYLQVLAENGIFGFVLFLTLLSSILFFGYKRTQEDIKEKTLWPLFLFAAILVFLFQGFFVSYFEYREMNYLFWMVVGLLLKKD